MKTHAVVEVGRKQYLVQKNDEIIVENLNVEPASELELPILLSFDADKAAVEMGAPQLKEVAKASVVENMKGDKIRVARFKSKVRYRRVTGFRPQLTKLKIVSI